MTEREWLASTDVRVMLQLVIGMRGMRVAMPSDPGHSLSAYTFVPRYSDRKLRLLACAVFRSNTVHNSGSYFRKDQESYAKKCESWADGGPELPADQYFYYIGNRNATLAAETMVENAVGNQEYVADILRCLFGNPFRPSGLSRVGPEWALQGSPWRTPYHMARMIYDERRWADLPILADMLEEAGCDDADVLAHLRGPGPHARGCWVLDLILGKE